MTTAADFHAGGYVGICTNCHSVHYLLPDLWRKGCALVMVDLPLPFRMADCDFVSCKQPFFFCHLFIYDLFPSVSLPEGCIAGISVARVERQSLQLPLAGAQVLDI